MRRRKVLVLTGSSMTAAIAGCGGGGEESADDSESTGDGGESTDDEEESMDGEESTDGEESMDDGEGSDDGSEEEAEPTPATLDFADIKPEGEEVEQGGFIVYEVVAANDGDEDWSGTLELTVDGDVVASAEHELGGGSIRTLSVEWQPAGDYEPGEYDVTASALDAEISTTVTVTEVAQEEEGSDLTISDVDGTPEDVMQQFFDLVDQGNFGEGYALYHSEGIAEEFSATDEAFIESNELTLVSTERVHEVDSPPRVVLDGVQDFSGDESKIVYDWRPEEIDGTPVWRLWDFALIAEGGLEDSRFRDE